MRQIKELVVVEGKHDSANLKRHFKLTTLETGGSKLSKEFIALLKQQKQDIIIFTDPDSNGQLIRERISQEITNCTHAYLTPELCRRGSKLGIEHASKEALEAALSNLISYQNSMGRLQVDDLVELGLTGNPEAVKRRQVLSAKFHLGKCNAKSLLKRLNALNIDKKQVVEVLNNV